MTELSADELRVVAERMSAAGVPVAGPLMASPIAGGRSNLTYVVSDGASRWVLRTPPRTGRTASAHDVAREHRVTAALMATDVPVAPAVLLCDDEDVLGVPFTVSGFVDGVGVRTQADLASYDDDALVVVVDSLLETLAALHRVDHEAIGLTKFGRPDGYAARQLRRWSGQWETVGTEALGPLAAEVLRGLDADLPEQRAVSVVHGDYRVDNALIGAPGAPGQGEVAAVVDWELSTIGDPVADVAMMCAYRDEAFDLVIGAPSA
ncbi:phosphotransferase family protein [Nocardioides sp. SYSU DS0651]|uniref:phosphotransferase family protein n=1 Tax=Nocardioides sp. SYSU DS0651 TaxID=3415955 RepID=UPI003F4B1D9B